MTATDELPLSTYAKETLDLLEKRGASFFQELVADGELLGTQVEKALGELVAMGAVTADSFAGLRALLTPSNKRSPLPGAATRSARSKSPFGVESAGRWSLLQTAAASTTPATS